MAKYLLALVLALVTAPALAGPVAPVDDSGKLYLTIFGAPQNADVAAVRRVFDSAEFRPIKDATFYNVYLTTSPMFARYRADVPTLPCLRLQSADGRNVIPEMAGQNFPHDMAALADVLKTQLYLHDSGLDGGIFDHPGRTCPGPDCPGGQCHRRPDPVVQPDPAPQPQPIADEPPAEYPLWPIGLGALAFVVAVYCALRARFSNQ